ncbi:MAG: aminoglycoside phosphotransferase family protein [Caldilineaceae bacterium]
MPPQPPPAQGVRLLWTDIPVAVRDAVEAELGSSVSAATSQPSGFSPGVASRLHLANGRRIFLKAVGPHSNPDAPGIHRREVRIVSALPANAPVPRLLGAYDEGDAGWIVMWFQAIDGREPAQPWQPAEFDRVLGALAYLSAALTPVPLAPGTVPSAATAVRHWINGWRRLADEDPAYLDQLDAWSRRHLAQLIDLEDAAPAAVGGETLLHFDLRADNILLTPERVWFVDWPHAHVGAAWVDVAFFAPSVTMQGGPPPKEILARHPAGRVADADAVTAAIAAIAGFFTHRALQPPPPGLPTLRAFQAAQGEVARAWVAERID